MALCLQNFISIVTAFCMGITLIIVNTSAEFHCPNYCDCNELYARVNCMNRTLEELLRELPKSAEKLKVENGSMSVLTTGSFSTLVHLSSLWIQNSGLQDIQKGAFEGPTDLLYVYLRNNLLETVRADMFEGLTAVKYLYLDRNYISAIPAGAFTPLKKLYSLYIRYNRLTIVDANVFSGLANLRWLYLSYNSISNISAQAFKGLTSIRKISLMNNSLTSVPKEPLALLGTLNYLNLGDNPIAVLNKTSFPLELKSLSSLYVNDMGLKDLNVDAFKVFPRLQTLSLEENLLETISPLNFLHTLQVLKLKKNPWLCDCQLIWLRTWIIQHQIKQEVMCQAPAGLQNQYLGNIDLKYLTCPPYEGSNTNMTSTATAITATTQIMKTTEQRSSELPRITSPSASKPRPATFKPPMTQTPKVCKDPIVQSLQVISKSPSTLSLKWEAQQERPRLGLDVLFFSKDTKDASGGKSHIGEQAAVLTGLSPGTSYKICVDLTTEAKKFCANSVTPQCVVASTLKSLPSDQQEKKAVSHASTGTAGTAVAAIFSVIIFAITVLALIFAWKKKVWKIAFRQFRNEAQN
ncbi:chondroadherin-like [Protopterus annectens]|uniref:chondroadherin-like n=1 Tax=Protopterus annectens TaxID=7888 RepID=UPI001CFBC7E2|nr:chondroadherin-like [Protopterus annectens]